MIRSKLTAFLLFCVLFVTPTYSRYIKRSTSSEEENNSMEVCHSSSPCAWGVYEQTTRRIEEIMRSPCVCPDNMKCLQHSDKPSISSYIYLCKSTENDDSGNSV